MNYEDYLLKAKKELRKVYEEHQYHNWDGYGAEPIYLKSLWSAEHVLSSLFNIFPEALKHVEIIPDPWGYIVLGWYYSNDNMVDITFEFCDEFRDNPKAKNQITYFASEEDTEDQGLIKFNGFSKDVTEKDFEPILEQIKTITKLLDLRSASCNAKSKE